MLKVFEELPDEGLACKYHNKLKNDVDAKVELVHSKGVKAYTQPNYARTWFYSNNKNKPLYIEPGDRRYTVHLIKGDKANCSKHFTPLWAEIKRPGVMLSAFKYFSNRVYQESNVMRAFETKAKKEMIERSVPHPIRFLIKMITEREFDNYLFCKFCDISDRCPEAKFWVRSTTMQNLYRNYCDSDIKYHRSALANSLKAHLNLVCDSQRKVDGKRPKFYVFTNEHVENALRKYLKSPEYKLDIEERSEESIDEDGEEDFYELICKDTEIAAV